MMSDNPIGPIEDSKEEKRQKLTPSPITNNDMSRVERGLNKMLYGGKQ